MPAVRAAAVNLRRGLRPAWARVAPFAIYLAFLAVSLALPAVLPTMDGRWVYPVKVGVVAAVLMFLWPHFEELAVPRLAPRDGLRALAIGIAVFFLWINLDTPWASLTPDNEAGGFDPRLADGRIDWLLAALRLAGAALVVPVMEELFWRSLVMRWFDHPDFLELDPRSVSRSALLASSVAFGFEHHLWLAGIIAGLAYGELYRRSGNLWAPILAHSVTNGLLGIWVLWSGHWQYW
jgi:CAAX prenyl protease-like protein